MGMLDSSRIPNSEQCQYDTQSYQCCRGNECGDHGSVFLKSEVASTESQCATPMPFGPELNNPSQAEAEVFDKRRKAR